MLRIIRSRPSALDLGPAALIVLVWAFLWAWVLAGVVLPLSRVHGAVERSSAVEERA
jgi:hypothetical protein